MNPITIVDELDRDRVVPYDLRDIGDVRRSAAHVLVVLAGEGEGVEYELMHPDYCDAESCSVAWQASEGGWEQPPGYPQTPKTPGLYLVRLESVKGGWVNGSHAVEHDAYFVFDDVLVSKPNTNTTTNMENEIEH